MVAILIILAVLMAVLFVAQVCLFKRLYKRYKDLDQKVIRLDGLYDGLEETVSKQYADLGTLGNRLTSIENQFVKSKSKKQ